VRTALERLFMAATLVAVFCGVDALLLAKDKPVEDFLALSDAERRALIQVALAERAVAMRNVQVNVVSISYNVAYKNGSLGASIKENGRFEADFSMLGGDYRAVIAWFVPEDKDRPSMRCETAMYRGEGVSRSLAEHGKLKGVYGAIDTKADAFLDNIGFLRWFDGTFRDPSFFVFQQLAALCDDLEFDATASTDNAVNAVLVFPDAKFDLVNRWEMLLSPSRGFLPVRLRQQVFRGKSVSKEAVLVEDAVEEVVDSRLIEGVWFPWQTKTIVTGPLAEKVGFTTIRESTVGKIEVGRLQAADLAVEFPNGTEVHDRIRGEWFQVGAPSPGTHPPASSRNTWLIIGLNVTAVGLILFIFALFRRRKLKAS
jgi:hypothetical protein